MPLRSRTARLPVCFRFMALTCPFSWLYSLTRTCSSHLMAVERPERLLHAALCVVRTQHQRAPIASARSGCHMDAYRPLA